MDTDEAIDTVVGLAKAFLVMNDNLQEGIKVQPNRLPKVEEAIKVLEGLKPSNIIDEVFDNEMNQIFSCKILTDQFVKTKSEFDKFKKISND